MFILDAHCDSPSQMFRLRDFHKDNDHAHVDFPKLRAGGIGASVFAMYIFPHLEGAEATAYALKLIAGVYDQVEREGDDIRLCFNASQLRENIDAKRISILMSLENGSPIQRSLNLLRVFKQLGISSIVLTHNADNEIGDAAAGHGRWGGLSPFGREVVAEMNRLGMMVDVSHAADTTAYDCLECSKSPIIASHSSCRSLNPLKRNISDDLMRRIADGGGFVGISIYPSFLSADFAATLASDGLEDRVDAIEEEFKADPSDPEKIAAWHAAQDSLLTLPRPDCKLVVDHIDHAVKVAGIDHIGIGTDYDGVCVQPVGLENVSKLGCIFDEMHSRGYSWDAIEKVAGLNYLRVLSDVERLAH
jgi:membrane dipeptidase